MKWWLLGVLTSSWRNQLAVYKQRGSYKALDDIKWYLKPLKSVKIINQGANAGTR